MQCVIIVTLLVCYEASESIGVREKFFAYGIAVIVGYAIMFKGWENSLPLINEYFKSYN